MRWTVKQVPRARANGDSFHAVRLEWRWFARAGSRIVGASSETYVRRSACIANAQRFGMRKFKEIRHAN